MNEKEFCFLPTLKNCYIFADRTPLTSVVIFQTFTNNLNSSK